MDKMIRRRESPSSLPDQLPIESSSGSSVDELVCQSLVEPKRLLRRRQTKQLCAILQRRVPERDKYFTKRAAGKEKCLPEESAPYEYPTDMEEFAQKLMTKAWRDDVRLKELQKRYNQRPNYRTRQQKDLLCRLYVEDAGPTSMKTVQELDPQYFEITEDRPIPENLKIREYIETMRKSLRTKIVTGYREDDAMLLDENLLLEQKMINIIRNNFQIYVNTFEEFLYRDHTESMSLLKDAETASNLAYDKYEEYKLIAKQVSAVRSNLYNSEEKWRNCKMYQRFLYSLSPSLWRQRHPIPGSIEEEDLDNEETIFGRYRLSGSQPIASLHDILEHFKEECSNDYEPVLYFERTEQLMEVFRFLEMQNLNSLLHCEELAGPLDSVKSGIRLAKEMLDAEITRLRQNVEQLEGGISWKEERAKYLERSANDLINNQFKKLVMEDDILNLHVFVEDTYETRVAPNDANLSLLQMMTAINMKYREELLMLDKVPRDQVLMLEGSCYMEQMTVMRLAEKASRQYAELQRVTRDLTKAFAKPYVKPTGKEAKNRSPPLASHKAPAAIRRSLTQSEEDHLVHFTEFCEHIDDPKDYGVDKTRALTEDSVSVALSPTFLPLLKRNFSKGRKSDGVPFVPSKN